MLVASIPSRYRCEPLIAEVRGLLYEDAVDRVLVYDNGYGPDDAARIRAALSGPRCTVVDAAGWPLHRMWNAGWEWAQEQGGEVSLAILNDDVSLPLGALTELEKRLRSRPDVGVVYPEGGRFRKFEDGIGPGPLVNTGGRLQEQRGMTGHAFMFRAEVRDIEKFDERFGWWYGDDDFVLKWALAGWKVCRAVGVPVKHVGMASSKGRPELVPIRAADGVLFRQLYPEWVDSKARYERWPDEVIE
jgi:hypothetical protein